MMISKYFADTKCDMSARADEKRARGMCSDEACMERDHLRLGQDDTRSTSILDDKFVLPTLPCYTTYSGVSYATV
jgi:hypothetical protein